jgi:hypothetical protein
MSSRTSCSNTAPRTTARTEASRSSRAEATAYLVAKELELITWDPAESRAYIQGWLAGAEVTDGHAQRIFAAVNKILTTGRVVVAQAVAA